MLTLILDTETTGLPLSKCPEKIEDFNRARMIELAYIIYDENKNEVLRKSNLVIPDNFEICNEHIHGISQRMASNNGKHISEIFKEFEQDLTNVEYIVAHNAIFDMNIIISECYRYNFRSLLDILKNKKVKCTLFLAKQCLQGKRSFKLTKLYSYFFEDEELQAHRALSDAIMCSRIYFHLMENYGELFILF